MKKIPLIDPGKYFQESEKAIQLVEDREKEVRRTMPAMDRLRLANKNLEKAKSREEYEELKNTIKELELELKYGKDYVPAIPEEYQNKIAFNRVHEEEKLDAELAKQKELLSELVQDLKTPLINVLLNIEGLERQKLIGKKIDILLEEKITLDPTIHSAFLYFKHLAYSSTHIDSEKSRENAEKLFKVLNEIVVSPEQQPTGMKKPSILSRVLGGEK